MLKVILGKLSLITLAASFAVGFISTEAVAAKGCRKECLGKADKEACIKKCQEKHSTKK